MFQLDVLIDTSVLPSNVMSLRDDKFIDFVKAEAGDGVAALLEIQGINCVKSLLMTSNVYSIMDVKSKSLDGFKNKYGYMLDDGTFIIQPGIKGNIEYLIDLLKKKCIEDAKLVKSSKHNQSSLSTIAKSTSSVPSNSSPEKIPSKSSNLSVDEHKTYIIATLNSWCQNNKSKVNLSQLSLIEDQHYFISIFNDASGALKCDIKCCCKKWSSLTLRRGKFQLSNFYRHIQGSNNNVCPQLKKMINNPQLPLPPSTNTQQSVTTSDIISQRVASPNFIPIIPPSDSLQSNSILSTASSISISSDNDENVVQQSSSSSKTERQVKRKAQTIESSYSTRESVKRTRRR
jgi:hypothetical protein